MFVVGASVLMVYLAWLPWFLSRSYASNENSIKRLHVRFLAPQSLAGKKSQAGQYAVTATIRK